MRTSPATMINTNNRTMLKASNGVIQLAGAWSGAFSEQISYGDPFPCSAILVADIAPPFSASAPRDTCGSHSLAMLF